MLQPHYENESSLITYPYEANLLGTTQITFQTRRKRHRLPPSVNTFAAESLEGFISPAATTTTASKRSSSPKSFVELAGLHKFVCFFIIQDDGLYQSNYVLTLRQRLATGYHDCMTIFVVPLNSTTTSTAFVSGSSGSSSLLEDPNDAARRSLFALGTGFTLLPPSALLRTVLNVTQVPTVVILDTSTGRPLSHNASLALEWNAPHQVLQAWHSGHSGLTTLQLVGAIVTCQGQECCTIL
jgi:hypothetical protein